MSHFFCKKTKCRQKVSRTITAMIATHMQALADADRETDIYPFFCPVVKHNPGLSLSAVSLIISLSLVQAPPTHFFDFPS
jgi:hypothetical protein